MSPRQVIARAVVIAALGAVPLTACTQTDAGTPAPVNSPVPTTSSASTADPFHGLKACDLLAPITDPQGYAPAVPEDYESDNGCGALKHASGFLTVYLVPNEGVDGLQVTQGQLSTIQIAGRDARQLWGDGGPGSCMIGIAITPTARATVGYRNSPTDTGKACAFARSVAEQISAKLPRSR
jgi:hypothetical protein